ncbi:MAG: DUF4864 domain-containing protein [Rhizobium sp.]|nr:DUF4864 domain-containing protein [Rhizobium sp.]
MIEQQITSFLNDDATTAYSFASPEIKSAFPNAERELDMVKKSVASRSKGPATVPSAATTVSPDGTVAYREVLISAPDGDGLGRLLRAEAPARRAVRHRWCSHRSARPTAGI